MGIIHSKNYSVRKKLFKKIFIQKNWKLFIQKNYSFFWKNWLSPRASPIFNLPTNAFALYLSHCWVPASSPFLAVPAIQFSWLHESKSHQIQFNCFTSAPLTCKWHESCIRPPQSPAKLSLLIILNSERRLLAYFEAVDAGEDRASPAFLSVMFFHLRGRWHNVKRTLFTQMAQGYGSVTWGFFTCSPQALHVKYTMLWK